MKTSTVISSGLTLLASILLFGCGGEQLDTAPVYGSVAFNGTPVSGGSLTFQPVAEEGEIIAGKPATAQVQEDGTYVLMTYEPGDGAVAGTHKVMYSPPLGGASGDHGASSDGAHAATPSRPNRVVPADQRTVEVKAGQDNEINFELVSGKAAAPARPAAAHGR